MGPIADRTAEHLGVSDTIIIKIRKLLLAALDDYEAGRPLPGLDPMSYQVRSARFRLAPGRTIADGVEEFARIRQPAAAK